MILELCRKSFELTKNWVRISSTFSVLRPFSYFRTFLYFDLSTSSTLLYDNGLSTKQVELIRTQKIDIFSNLRVLNTIFIFHQTLGTRNVKLACKGGDLAHAIGSLLPNLVELVITNSCYVINPIGVDLTYKSLRYPSNWPSYNAETAYKYERENVHYNQDDHGLYSFNSPIPNGNGYFRMFHYDNNFMFAAKNGEWVLNRDAFMKSKQAGYPITETNKIVHFQTTADPTQAPTSALAKEIAELALEGTNADLDFINSGHLCILPTIPMSTKSVVAYGNAKVVMEWSRRSHDEKPDEAKECEKLYRCILSKLEQYF